MNYWLKGQWLIRCLVALSCFTISVQFTSLFRPALQIVDIAKESVPNIPSTNTTAETRPQQSDSVEFFGWWWTEDLMIEDSSDKHPEELLMSTRWSDRRVTGETMIEGIDAFSSRDVKFHLNLRKVVNKYLSKDFTRLDLWPWKLRVRVTVRTFRGEPVAFDQGILNVIPGD